MGPGPRDSVGVDHASMAHDMTQHMTWHLAHGLVHVFGVGMWAGRAA